MEKNWGDTPSETLKKIFVFGKQNVECRGHSFPTLIDDSEKGQNRV